MAYKTGYIQKSYFGPLYGSKILPLKATQISAARAFEEKKRCGYEA